ncbi:transposable element Tcb2 transposase [Trichonephila clavipes]|nr:transposable element Tcb2 transposase [Trichonephila clavipes]
MSDEQNGITAMFSKDSIDLGWFNKVKLDLGEPEPSPSAENLYIIMQEKVEEKKIRNCWEQWTREGTHARKTGYGATRKTTRREDRAASTCGPHSDSFNDTNRRRRSNCSTNNLQTPCRSNSYKSKRPLRALPLTPEHRQLRLQWCQARSMWNVRDWQKVVFSDESRFVLGTDDNRVRVWRLPARVAQDFLRHFQTLPWTTRSPDLSPVLHLWDQLKRQMPSCHSGHDLELAVQDLGAHLPQDNIKCLINSMPDRVAACIAAGCGPTRY